MLSVAFFSRCKISASEVRAFAESIAEKLKSDTAVLTLTFSPFRNIEQHTINFPCPTFVIWREGDAWQKIGIKPVNETNRVTDRLPCVPMALKAEDVSGPAADP